MVKIGPKMFQERITNNFDEARTRRGEKKDIKDDKRKPKEVTVYIDNFVFRCLLRLPGEDNYQL